MTIGYGYQVINPGFQADQQNTDLIAKVLLTKQSEFNSAYAGLSELKKQSLGIQFINAKEQSKIDNFNKEVDNVFSKGEFGDLSDARVSTKYYNLFDKIGSDPALIQRYRQDAAYQKQLRDVEMKRNAKDPAKAGFGSINYQNFLSRLGDYAKMDLDSPEAQGYVVSPYTDYVDINKELGERIKQVPIQKFEVPEVKNGYIVTKTYTGRDPEAVKAAVQDYMGSRGAAQLKEEAEYTFRQSKNNKDFQSAIYADHVAYNTRAQQQISSEIDKVQADLKSAQASGNTDKIQELAAQQARLEDAFSKLNVDMKSPDEFFSRSQDEIVNDLSSIALQDVVGHSSSAYGGYAISTKIAPDQAYLSFKQMEQRATEFQISKTLEQQKMAQDLTIAQAKLAQKSGGSTTTSLLAGGPTDGSSPIAPNPNDTAPNYISASDPTHVSFVDTVDSAKASLTKFYAQSANIFRDGTSNGDNQVSGENTMLSLLINPKSMDESPYYGDNVYLQAFKKALEGVYQNDRELSDLIGKTPTNDYEWNRLKELGTKVRAEVDRILSHPKDTSEATIMNSLQDVYANTLSLQEFMDEASKSNDPETFIKNKQNINIYTNAVYDLELPENASRDQKARVTQLETLFRPTFENYVDVPADEYNPRNTTLNSDEWNKQFSNPDRVRNIPFGAIRKVEAGPDGTLKIFPKESAFQVAKKGEDIDPQKSGVFSNDSGYIMVKNGSDYKKVTNATIKAQGYFEIKDPRFSRMNWANQLGFTVGVTPQKRWAASKEGTTVPFEVRRSSLTNKVQASVAGRGWVEFNTSDVTQVINQLRQMIASRPYAEITDPNTLTTPTAPYPANTPK